MPTASTAKFQQPKGPSLSDIQLIGRGLPTKLEVQGVQGIGKTSFAFHAPSPLYVVTELGVETLIDAKQISETPFTPRVETWRGLLAILDELATAEHDYKTLVIDTINGVEELCFNYVCNKRFDGDWGVHGFMSYQQGPRSAAVDWRQLLNQLDVLREERRMAIILISHTAVTTFKNPEGADYDRFAPVLSKEIWRLTDAWADIVLFYNYETIVSEKDPTKKGKGRGGGNIRFLYTQRTAAWDAKNRHGLPFEIEAGSSSQETWDNFIAAKKAAQQKES